MRRRALLGTLATGALPLAGCVANPAGGAATAPLPDACPTTQDLGVEWPSDLDRSTVEAFIEAYEEAYYMQAVFEFDPASRFSRVGSAITRVKDLTEAGRGWRARFSGTLGVNRAFTRLAATRSEPPDEGDVVPADEIEDERLTGLLEEAAETGEAEEELDAERTDAYVDRFESLAKGFEISPPEYHDTLYIDVDGTVVELAVSVDTYHADRMWEAWYYVDERVVWRSSEAGTDPRDADLLECRTEE